MGCSPKPILPPFTFLLFLFITTFDYLIVIHSLSPLQQPLRCHDDESSALMHFKQSLSIIKDEFISEDPFSYPKVASWNSSSSDCCSWDGVTCDHDTSRVIALDLSNSFLSGFIYSNTTLFRLVHLQRLNLADNYFNKSQIPSALGLLSRLTYLNLSYTEFAGQIPFEISNLTKLTSLDLSRNPFLKLQKPGLSSLVQNLTTDLKELHLSWVNISSAVLDILANYSSLTSLLLEDCGLHGELPAGIFKLPNLQFLSVGNNQELSGYLPEFYRRSPLKLLRVAGTSFSGGLPNSIRNLDSLNELDITNCNFSGSVPTSIGNLSQLRYLDLSGNNFFGEVPNSIGYLQSLNYLNMEGCNFTGSIPSSFDNLSQLRYLVLSNNHFTGQIPSSFGSCTQLVHLYLSSNLLHGPIPESISQLVNLEAVDLSDNNLNGTAELDLFYTQKKLTTIILSGNQLTLLGLHSCNLTEFSYFLKTQNNLKEIDLSNNRIQGSLPPWIWNMSTSAHLLDLSQNFITGFHQPHPLVLPLDGPSYLDLSSNKLQGSFPLPSSSTFVYNVANNKLTGEIPLLMCNATSLYVLDLSYNNLSGIIPQCLGSFSDDLTFLNLRNNRLRGPIPQTYKNGTRLRMINLSQNQLQGPVSSSLVNCSLLESLDLGSNQISDIFPSWLGTLPDLKVLILRFNRFHGAIWNPNSSFGFPQLHILDLSYNGFTGKLPSNYFHTWTAMETINVNQSRYFGIAEFSAYNGSTYAMTLTNKGVQIVYLYILNIFTVIDLSSNRFEGEIPESIGILKTLHMLNLSNNNLIGQIPFSLENLTELESLDLSQNKLSGEIPLQLTQLTFLEFFNVSHNHLTGPIPEGRQFHTFENSSYKGNSGLCGEPLSKKCGNLEASPPPPPKFKQDDDDDSWFPIDKRDWVVICMGCVSGLVVGLIIGHTLTTSYHEWFVSTFARNQKNQRRKKKCGGRS